MYDHFLHLFSNIVYITNMIVKIDPKKNYLFRKLSKIKNFSQIMSQNLNKIQTLNKVFLFQNKIFSMI